MSVRLIDNTWERIADGVVRMQLTAGDFLLDDDVELSLGSSADVQLVWSTGDASNHSFVVALGDTNQSLHITDKGAIATDWNISADTHPTVYIHSNTTPATDYLKLGAHDGTTAYIDNVGGTTLQFAIAGTNEYTLTAAAFSPATNDGGTLGTTTLGWADLHLATGGVINWANGEITLTAAADTLTIAGGDFLIGNGQGIVVGHTAQVAVQGVTPEFQMQGTAPADSSASLAAWSADAVGPDLYFAKSRSATIGTFSIITTGDILGRVVATGDDGVDFNANTNASTRIDFVSSGTIAADRVPGEMRFLTATDAAPSVITEAMRITNAQNLHILNNNGIVVGHSTPLTSVVGVSEVQVLGTAEVDSAVVVGQWSADALGPRIEFIKSRNATIGSSTIVADNDVAGSLVWALDDGTDFANPAAIFRAEVDDATPAANDVGTQFTWLSQPGGGSAISEAMVLRANGDLQFPRGSQVVQSSSADEMAFVVTNEALTIGTEGTVVIPYRSSTDAAFTDTEGGNLNGAIGVQYDSDAGPTSTIEVRSNGAWVSVAVTGYLMQAKVEYDPSNPNVLVHPRQVFEADGRYWIDESKCAQCGEDMEPGEVLSFFANYERSDGSLHAIFCHTRHEIERVVGKAPKFHK